MPLVSMGGKKAFPKPRAPKPKQPTYHRLKQRSNNEYNSIAQTSQNRIQNQAKKARQTYESQINNLINSYHPVNIPTFSPSYYEPQNTLKKMKQVQNAGPNINTSQLQQIAQNSVNMATNPEIEALRKQISGLKSLGPKQRKQVMGNYRTAQEQLANNTNDLIAQATKAAKSNGGLHSGVASAISKVAQQHSGQLSDILQNGQNLDLKTLAGYLQTQQQNANSLLNTIQKNKKNMTKTQFNALRDQAVKQSNTAKQAQLKLLQSMAQIESGARSTAAGLLQNKAKAKNNMKQQIFNINKNLINTENKNRQNQLQNMQSNIQGQLKNYNTQLQNQLTSQYQNNLNQWMNYLTGPDTRTAADAIGKLQANQSHIMNSLGPQGYQALEKQLNQFSPGWVNPNAQLPWNVVNNSARSPRVPQTQNNVVQSQPSSIWDYLGNAVNGLFNQQ